MSNPDPGLDSSIANGPGQRHRLSMARIWHAAISVDANYEHV